VSCACFFKPIQNNGQLQYASTMWSTHHGGSDLTKIEKVQMKATNYMCRTKHLS